MINKAFEAYSEGKIAHRNGEDFNPPDKYETDEELMQCWKDGWWDQHDSQNPVTGECAS